MSGQHTDVLVVGSGISGLSTAIRAAELGLHVCLASPYPSERSQSVMAAGGINAALDTMGESDTPALHARETLSGGCQLEDPAAVEGLCAAAPDVVRWLEEIGVVFSRQATGELAQRPFGGQSKRRTAFAGTSTGKQIVTALVQRCRELELAGAIERRLGISFHSALIDKSKCFGALFSKPSDGSITRIEADATVFAVGGMNGLFGKTTGSTLCDGFAAGQLLSQGVSMRNLEFIQYHPTTIESPLKRMLVSEAARGEGGRLYYLRDGERVYFMEDEYGERGNLMPRDVVSRHIAICPSQVYLDISFLGADRIHERLQEVFDLCLEYIGIDVTRESIPVAPSVHFFMGGILVDDDHRSSVEDLYAVGECASKYHGANRLGGNSLLAAAYSGRVAAQAIAGAELAGRANGTCFERQIAHAKDELGRMRSGSLYALPEILREIAPVMRESMGIVRDRRGLEQGLAALEELAGDAGGDYRSAPLLLIARATILSALHRQESRGAHQRLDFPHTDEGLQRPTIAACEDGDIVVSYGRESGADASSAHGARNGDTA